MTQRESYKTIETLEVYRQGELAGSLSRTPQGCVFHYEPVFLQNPKFNGLSYTMPKKAAPIEHLGVNLPPFFAGLLPEGVRLSALVRALKTSEDDLFTLLAATGERCVGDVYARAPKRDRPVARVPKLSEVDFYEFFYQSAQQGLFQKESESLAGVQRKISSSMINFPINVTKRDRSYILKLNPEDKPNLIENELTVLKLAAKCGLLTNKAKLVRDSKKNLGLLVERFDRVGPRPSQMLHQEDACQFLDRYPADKYRLSLNEVAEGMVLFSSAPKIDILRLLQLYAFSYLIGNGDLHAKNISLQTTAEGRVQLTQVYDVLTTYLYGDHKMALKIDGRDDKIKRKTIVAFAARFGVAAPAIRSMLNKLIEKLRQHHALLFNFPMSSGQRSQLEKMLKRRSADMA